MPVTVMIYVDDISLIVNKKESYHNFFFLIFDDNFVVTDCYLSFTCTFYLCFFLFEGVRGAFNIQASNAILQQNTE